MSRFLRDFYVGGVLATMAGVLAVYVYWQFIDGMAPPIRVLSSQTDKGVYRQGETMTITRMQCIDRAGMDYVVSRAFVDHIVYQLSNYPTQAPEVGCKMRSIGIEIPPALPPGVYVYKVFATVRLNPIKTIRVDYPDLPSITVIARDS